MYCLLSSLHINFLALLLNEILTMAIVVVWCVLVVVVGHGWCRCRLGCCWCRCVVVACRRRCVVVVGVGVVVFGVGWWLLSVVVGVGVRVLVVVGWWLSMLVGGCCWCRLVIL